MACLWRSWWCSTAHRRPCPSLRTGVRVVHEPRRGPAAARNTGIRVSTGEVIALVDDDCEPSPPWLAAAVDALRKAGPDAVVAGAITRSGADRNLVSRFDALSYLRQKSYVRYSKALVTANMITHTVRVRPGRWVRRVLPRGRRRGLGLGWRAGQRRGAIVYDEKAAIDHPCMTDARPCGPRPSGSGGVRRGCAEKHDPQAAPVGLLDEISRQARRSRGHHELPLDDRLRFAGLSVMVGYWMWRGRRWVGRDRGRAHLMSIAKDPHDPALGGNMIGGDPQTFHPALWEYLIDRFSIRSMLDIGCGEGHCLQYCADLGIDVKGFDGLPANIERAVAPSRCTTFGAGPSVGRPTSCTGRGGGAHRGALRRQTCCAPWPTGG